MNIIRKRPISLGLLLLVLAPSLSRADEPELTYEKHIRPIFRAHCFDCHGATEEIEGGLDLRLVRFLEKGGDSGPAIVTGNVDESYLIERVRSGDMPPGEGTVSAEELATLEQWIAQGAKTARPEPESIGPGLGITPEERSFWSFQPIQRPAVPRIAPPRQASVRTPIDAFVLNAMPDGLAFSADADRFTLIRRAYFDLIGLPPTADELQRWLNEPGEDWYERLLTELLDSPHYGERWGRHWLDIAGYADSEGYTVADAVRPWAWKYRDWVIRSLNEDKPFDQFIIEQLAGDELAGPREGDLTPEQIELLTATGFLRMAADGTGSGANNAEGRNQVMADTLKIVGTSLLGLSLQCAQCHDHRYDPIPHTDYFAIRAVFEPALDWKSWQVPNARRVSLYTEADRKQAAEIEAEAQKIAAEKATKQAEYMEQALEKELAKFEEPLREQLRTAYKTPAGERTDEQKALLDSHPSVKITPGVLYQYLPDAAEDLKGYDKRIAEVRAKKPPEEFIRALVEPAGHVPETRLFHRGDHEQPKQVVAPAGLTVAAPEGEYPALPANDPELSTTGRRLAFARWLTSGRHPLVARVIVNRVWMHHFGRGLVSTPSDFGKLGGTPTHPELLDWLASEFVESGWSLKKLHRLILTSTVWRQQSAVDDQDPRYAIDSTNTYYWRKPLVRLEAELLRDRMLTATGRLDRKLFGAPVSIKEDETGQVVVDGEQTRRSLYIQARRSQPVAMLQAFDAPVMETNCERRPVSTVATQSLMLLNGEFILDQAGRLADRAASEPHTLTDDRLASLPPLPAPPQATWHYGYGAFDESTQRVVTFTPLPHWTGSAWRGGENLPDPTLGWTFLTATGGHTDVLERSPIRRWTAPADGVVTIAGTLQHGSENGDGVRGRIVSSRAGLAGEWTAHAGSSETNVSELAVAKGDTIDFVTDCITNYTSDSFNWPVTITLKVSGQPDRTFATADGFHGPASPPESLPGQVVRAWELAFCRQPNADELSLAMQFLARQLDVLRRDSAMVPSGRTPERQALTNLCHALLSSNEFLYVD
ncbi:Planctomycete cytochrome C [Maioricimonas rarisocia]|uniref:Planctomycete cytochrome C n=1 Tax=Maioricimonas rarisocia TaxID=2528026 RepID=A0A517Z1D8_9PLAN|nr:PSD1 and planctomycete cytochrome C domain-containing protein [Maioricimonas rarisocia]QDU36297.1 Planctomycete cytochrome C [Maioricimonas rarisocia]